MTKPIAELTILRRRLRKLLKPKEPNIYELEQIYLHFAELGYCVEFTKGKVVYQRVPS